MAMRIFQLMEVEFFHQPGSICVGCGDGLLFTIPMVFTTAPLSASPASSASHLYSGWGLHLLLPPGDFRTARLSSSLQLSGVRHCFRYIRTLFAIGREVVLSIHQPVSVSSRVTEVGELINTKLSQLSEWHEIYQFTEPHARINECTTQIICTEYMDRMTLTTTRPASKK